LYTEQEIAAYKRLAEQFRLNDPRSVKHFRAVAPLFGQAVRRELAR
jgi:hypothetical protein